MISQERRSILFGTHQSCVKSDMIRDLDDHLESVYQFDQILQNIYPWLDLSVTGKRRWQQSLIDHRIETHDIRVISCNRKRRVTYLQKFSSIKKMENTQATFSGCLYSQISSAFSPRVTVSIMTLSMSEQFDSNR